MSKSTKRRTQELQVALMDDVHEFFSLPELEFGTLRVSSIEDIKSKTFGIITLKSYEVYVPIKNWLLGMPDYSETDRIGRHGICCQISLRHGKIDYKNVEAQVKIVSYTNNRNQGENFDSLILQYLFFVLRQAQPEMIIDSKNPKCYTLTISPRKNGKFTETSASEWKYQSFMDEYKGILKAEKEIGFDTDETSVTMKRNKILENLKQNRLRV